MLLPRIRQVVVAAADLDAVAADLERELGVASPFVDEGVGHFGLRNAVYSLGDSFLEIVSPTGEGTAVGRHLERCGGDGGYMVMLETTDTTATRLRLEHLGVRIVWDTPHPDIVDLHLHPKDVGGALVALDITDPVGSWRWGGPAWTGTAPEPTPGGVRGLTVATPDPDKTAHRWAEVIGLDEPRDAVASLAGGAQQIHFIDGGCQAERVVAVAVEVPRRRGTVAIAGVRFDRIDSEGRHE